MESGGSVPPSTEGTVSGASHQSAKEELPKAARAPQVGKAVLQLALPFGSFQRSVPSVSHRSLMAFSLPKERQTGHCLKAV